VLRPTRRPPPIPGFAKSFKIQSTTPILSAACPLRNPQAEGSSSKPSRAPLNPEELDRVYASPSPGLITPCTKRTRSPVHPGGPLQHREFARCFGACTFVPSPSTREGSYGDGAQVDRRRSQDPRRASRLQGLHPRRGRPTANFRSPACAKQLRIRRLRRPSMPFPRALQEPRRRPYGVPLHPPGTSGPFPSEEGLHPLRIRFDYSWPIPTGLSSGLCEHHVSASSRSRRARRDRVLKAMGKPPAEVYRTFETRTRRSTTASGRSSTSFLLHLEPPGSDPRGRIELAEYFRDRKFIPEQVQDFYPTPGTSPRACTIPPRPANGQNVYVPKTYHEKPCSGRFCNTRTRKTTTSSARL
jgi:hypothetical protein